MTKIKFCGIKSLEDASFGIKLGVDALGFNFFSKSPRCLTKEDAQVIIRSLPPKAKFVGVFVNHTRDEVLEIARTASLDTLQFHGEEGPEFCKSFLDEWTVIKAIRLREDTKTSYIDSFKDSTDHLLFDRYDEFLYGGSGEEIDVGSLEAKKVYFKNAFLAGGLNPENVAERVKTYQPYGVDVASGIEKAPGVKDRGLMSDFIKAVRG